MTTSWRGRVVFLVLFISTSGYEVPDLNIKLLKPKGFQASIPDIPGEISFFVFQGHVNRTIKEGQVGSLTGEILKPEGGLWIYRNRDVKLQTNDVINYYTVIVHKGQRYIQENLKFVVPDSTVVPSPRTPTDCTASLTRIRGTSTPPCSGDVVFEETFGSLDSNKWQIQSYIPESDYGYPFVSYQTKAVSVSNGNLVITPALQRDQQGYNSEKIYTGTLDLYNGCTGPEDSCFIQANSWDILPPVVSGKVTTKEFAFTYGLIEVRAKMPIGDWLYSEIHLESFAEKFGGFNKITKIMKIASTRGSEYQSDGCGNRVLYGGLIVSPKCRDELLSTKNHTGNWGNDFHVYSTEWRPDTVILRVDGAEWGRVEGRIQDTLGPECDVPSGMLAGSVDMTPFDTHYFLSLGVAAGGLTEFTDGISVGVNRKPWKNKEAKAKLKFWKHQNRWTQTWKNPSMLVDYVKVTAL